MLALLVADSGSNPAPRRAPRSTGKESPPGRLLRPPLTNGPENCGLDRSCTTGRAKLSPPIYIMFPRSPVSLSHFTPLVRSELVTAAAAALLALLCSHKETMIRFRVDM